MGNLSPLCSGTPTQHNPINPTGPTLNYPFTGVTFTGVSSAIPSLGASVAGVTLSSTSNGILIGAPNANSGSGEAFLISGNFAKYAGQTIDLSLTPAQLASTYSGLTIYEFVNTASYATSGAAGFLGRRWHQHPW